MIFWGGFHEVWEEAWQEADYLRAFHCTNRQTWVASLQSLKMFCVLSSVCSNDIISWIFMIFARRHRICLFPGCTAPTFTSCWCSFLFHISSSYSVNPFNIYNFMKNTVAYLGIVFGVLGQKNHAWESCIVLTKSFPYLSFLFVILTGQNSLQSELSSPILGCWQDTLFYRQTALVCADHHYHQTEAVGVESIIGYIMMHIVQYELSSSSSTLQALVVLHLVLTNSESTE